jgi:hypothetical protein
MGYKRVPIGWSSPLAKPTPLSIAPLGATLWLCGPWSELGRAMKARSLIDGSSFGPDALKAIGNAFDEAWAEIAGNFAGDPIAVESARHTLANAILSVSTDSSRDVQALKTAGLEAMARNYTSLPIVTPDP